MSFLFAGFRQRKSVGEEEGGVELQDLESAVKATGHFPGDSSELLDEGMHSRGISSTRSSNGIIPNSSNGSKFPIQYSSSRFSSCAHCCWNRMVKRYCIPKKIQNHYYFLILEDQLPNANAVHIATRNAYRWLRRFFKGTSFFLFDGMRVLTSAQIRQELWEFFIYQFFAIVTIVAGIGLVFIAPIYIFADLVMDKLLGYQNTASSMETWLLESEKEIFWTLMKWAPLIHIIIIRYVMWDKLDKWFFSALKESLKRQYWPKKEFASRTLSGTGRRLPEELEQYKIENGYELCNFLESLHQAGNNLEAQLYRLSRNIFAFLVLLLLYFLPTIQVQVAGLTGRSVNWQSGSPVQVSGLTGYSENATSSSWISRLFTNLYWTFGQYLVSGFMCLCTFLGKLPLQLVTFLAVTMWNRVVVLLWGDSSFSDSGPTILGDSTISMADGGLLTSNGLPTSNDFFVGPPTPKHLTSTLNGVTVENATDAVIINPSLMATHLDELNSGTIIAKGGVIGGSGFNPEVIGIGQYNSSAGGGIYNNGSSGSLGSGSILGSNDNSSTGGMGSANLDSANLDSVIEDVPTTVTTTATIFRGSDTIEQIASMSTPNFILYYTMFFFLAFDKLGFKRAFCFTLLSLIPRLREPTMWLLQWALAISAIIREVLDPIISRVKELPDYLIFYHNKRLEFQSRQEYFYYLEHGTLVPTIGGVDYKKLRGKTIMSNEGHSKSVTSIQGIKDHSGSTGGKDPIIIPGITAADSTGSTGSKDHNRYSKDSIVSKGSDDGSSSHSSLRNAMDHTTMNPMNSRSPSNLTRRRQMINEAYEARNKSQNIWKRVFSFLFAKVDPKNSFGGRDLFESQGIPFINRRWALTREAFEPEILGFGIPILLLLTVPIVGAPTAWFLAQGAAARLFLEIWVLEG